MQKKKKKKPQVIGQVNLRQTSSDSWSCTCYWFLTSENCDCLVSGLHDSPLNCNCWLRKNQSPRSYDTTTSRETSVLEIATKQAEILWGFTIEWTSKLRGQLTFGHLVVSLSSITPCSSGLSFSVSWMLFSLCTSCPQRSSIHLGPTSDCYCVLCI